MSDTAIESVRANQDNRAVKEGKLDEYLTHLCLDCTIGDVLHIRETATNGRASFGASLVCDAVFGKDIGVISILANRIDGGVPSKEKRSVFANYIGDALDDVLSYTNAEQTKVFPTDTSIIAIAKVILYIAMQEPGKNVQAKKEKQQAIEMVLSRTGGRLTEPVRVFDEEKFEKPEWMRSLSGETQDS